MNIITEIKTFFQVKPIVTTIYKEATTMNDVKPGYKTTEFWVKVITIDLPMIWGVVHSFVPATLAVEIELGATAVYTIGRVVVKAVNDIKSARAASAPATATATATAS